MRRIRTIISITVLAVMIGALPALADDDGDIPEESTTEETTSDYSATKWALLLSAEFSTPPEDVATLRDLGLGWGDLFKLEAFATAMGVDVATLLSGATVDPDTGEYEFDWGALKASLTDEQLAILDGLPKNLGQVVSAFQRHHGRDEHRPDHAGKPDDAGKPDHAGKPDDAGSGDDDGSEA